MCVYLLGCAGFLGQLNSVCVTWLPVFSVFSKSSEYFKCYKKNLQKHMKNSGIEASWVAITPAQDQPTLFYVLSELKSACIPSFIEVALC